MLTAQSLLVVGCVVGVHQVPLHGNFGLLYFMVFLQGFCGMSCGLMLASVFTNHTMFVQMTLLIILPLSYISGIWWTKYSMVTRELRIFSSILPSTIPAEAMRDVLTRGWDASHT